MQYIKKTCSRSFCRRVNILLLLSTEVCLSIADMTTLQNHGEECATCGMSPHDFDFRA
jgi:hypothetical protein